MNWTHIRILYLRELRSALRERTIVVNSILMPIFLYPLLLWFMFTGITFVQGLSEGRVSRVALFDAASAVQVDQNELRARLAATPELEIDHAASLDAAHEALRAGDLDAIVEFSAGATAEDLAVAVRFDGAVDRSRRARDRVRETIDEVRSDWLETRSAPLGIASSPTDLFEVRSHNVSSEDELGAMLLGQLLSLFIVIMVALGCFIPSVDTTAGERERSTWETLMTVSASRSSVIASKYLYVATLGILAGLLNVAAMFASIGAILRPLMEQGDRGLTFSLAPLALPVMMAGAVGLALFFAAAMMILASFARTFKDGQAMVQPVYWLVFVPMLLGQQSDTTLTPAIAAIPVANVAMMIRDAVNGIFLWPLIAEVLAVTTVTVVVCLWIARHILRFEDYLLGSYDGSFWRFAKQRLFSGSSHSTAS